MKNNRPSVLIIEDDANLVLVLKQFILSLGLNVESTYSGRKGFKKAVSNKFQLFIIDLGLGDICGLKLIEKIRRTNNKPIIIITGNVEENNEIECFKLKANIFHKKPINFDILAVQIKSLISPRGRGNIIASKNIHINLNKRVFSLDDQVIPFTKREFNFLAMLFNSNGEVFTRKQIIYNIMNYFSSPSENCVDTMVSRIRKKLKEKDIRNSLIKTVNSTGYKLNSEYFKNIKRSFS